MGGQDVVYVKQDRSSPLSPSEIKEHLDRLGDQLFTGTCTLPPSNRKLREHKSKVSDTRSEQLFLVLCMLLNWTAGCGSQTGP